MEILLMVLAFIAGMVIGFLAKDKIAANKAKIRAEVMSLEEKVKKWEDFLRSKV